jgi:signal transduction histidine kinase
MARRRLLSALWLRLTLAFVAVAVAGVALLAGLTLASDASQVASLSRSQQQTSADAIMRSLGAAYRQAGSWVRADLESALTLAAEAGASIAVFDPNHHLVATGEGQSGSQQGPGATGRTSQSTEARGGRTVTRQLRTGGRLIGSVKIRFSAAEPAEVVSLRAGLVRAVVLGACFAALLAVAVALVVSRRISRPLAALTRVARAREAGHRSVRVGQLRAAGELVELGLAFDRMADAVTRQDELRRSLVADVAHELRTPISVLQASCEALLDGVVSPSPEVISSLRDEILRLAHRVEDLELLASAEAAELQLSANPVDLAAVASAAAAALSAGFAAARVELEMKLVSVTVSGDRERLHQVVTNLLTNALKYTPAGGRVLLEVGPDGASARLAVSDTGPGMSPDELGHVFERFWRGSAAQGTEGSGIGLAIVAELVRIHGGAVKAQSKPGRGSTFVVSLPRR